MFKTATTKITSTAKAVAPKSKSFGTAFGPVMFQSDMLVKNGEKSWTTPELSNYGDISLPSMAGSLHYGLQCFDTITAVKGSDGAVRLFRPLEHIRRFQQSALRIAFPAIEEAELFEAVKLVAEYSQDFVPEGPKQRIQIRLLMVGNNCNLSAGAADQVKLVISTAAVDASFSEFDVVANPGACRAWPGGTGDVQIGANYANHIYYETAAKKFANDKDARVLWTGAADPKLHVQQAGDLNVFFKIKGGPLVTPALDGTVLPGVTRATLLEVLRTTGTPVEERAIPLAEVLTLISRGSMEDAFATGNAPLLARIRSVLQEGQQPLALGSPRGLAEEVYDMLLKTQIEDSLGFCTKL